MTSKKSHIANFFDTQTSHKNILKIIHEVEGIDENLQNIQASCPKCERDIEHAIFGK